MATDPNKIFIPQSAKLYLAPVGTAAPDGPTVAIVAPWVEVGLFTPDSLQIATDPNFEAVTSHQSNWPTRRFQTADAATVQCNLQEWSTANFKAVFGGGAVTSVTPSGGGTAYMKFTPPSVGGRTETAAIIEIADGTRQARIIVPRSMQTEGASLNLNKTNETTLPLRLSILGSDVAAPWYIITNDSAAFPIG
jgi:hypothetical protein